MKAVCALVLQTRTNDARLIWPVTCSSLLTMTSPHFSTLPKPKSYICPCASTTQRKSCRLAPLFPPSTTLGTIHRISVHWQAFQLRFVVKSCLESTPSKLSVTWPTQTTRGNSRSRNVLPCLSCQWAPNESPCVRFRTRSNIFCLSCDCCALYPIDQWSIQRYT